MVSTSFFDLSFVSTGDLCKPRLVKLVEFRFGHIRGDFLGGVLKTPWRHFLQKRPLKKFRQHVLQNIIWCIVVAESKRCNRHGTQRRIPLTFQRIDIPQANHASPEGAVSLHIWSLLTCSTKVCKNELRLRAVDIPMHASVPLQTPVPQLPNLLRIF